MYTKGIRKIHEHKGMYRGLEELFDSADKSGYKACLHNGAIYVRTPEAWVLSPFTIEDFED